MKKHSDNRLIVLIGFIMVVSFTLLAIYVLNQEFKHIEVTKEEEISTIATIISRDHTLIDIIENDINQMDFYVTEHYVGVNDVSLILIDTEGDGNYYYPDDVYITSGMIDLEVLNEETLPYGVYLTTNDGKTKMVFMPIEHNSDQIGYVGVGINYSTIHDIKIEKLTHITIAFGIGLILSLLSLWGLTKRYKSELFGLSPSKIAMLYAENNSIIEQINEGIISIDANYNVTRVNKTLIEMFNIKDDLVGNKVMNVFPHVDFENIINDKKHIENKYKKINKEKYLMSAFPLYLDEEIIGATAIFRTHLEVDSLIDQISGYQSIAKALRSQKHEFQNKLHVVLGLIKMKDYEKAENYIMENVYTTNLASDYYTSRIKDDRVLALFVGKEIQSSEFNVELLLTSDSYMTKTHNPINSDDIVLVLGNLIDNSFEAYRNSDVEDKKVVVDIFEDEEQIKLTVIDQAGGIDEKVISKMFERGVSTKHGDSRGTGLSLVNEIITVYSGEKHVESTVEETKIEIILMKVIS